MSESATTNHSGAAGGSGNGPSDDESRIRGFIAEVDSDVVMDEAARTHVLDVFEQYECWGPFFRLLKRCIDDPKTRSVQDFVRLARVQNLYLEDVFAAAQSCAEVVDMMRLPYQRFAVEVVPQVIEFEDFAAEATILSAVVDKLPAPSDAVACLERLCMLYEKKTHNETQLGKTYEKLLAIDPRNVKALRYFKLVFTQNNEWDEVVGTLRTLLGCVVRPQEIFRTAQELAAIYLYQLDMAEQAIEVLETYCNESPLDTSTILYDAYQRLADWQGCLRVLRQCILNVDNDHNRAVLHFKIASLHEQLGDLANAQDNFAKTIRLQPDFLDGIEGLINVGVLRQDWPLVNQWLKTLMERVQDERLRTQLEQAQIRLQDGLSHAGKQP